MNVTCIQNEERTSPDVSDGFLSRSLISAKGDWLTEDSKINVVLVKDRFKDLLALGAMLGPGRIPPIERRLAGDGV